MRAAGTPEESASLETLLGHVAAGDHAAYDRLYGHVAALVQSVARRTVRDVVRAQEVAQESLLLVWTEAGRFDADQGSARSWIATLTHRRAVDAVRHDQASADRERRYPWHREPAGDPVGDEVVVRFEHAEVRACLDLLTTLQRQAVTMAYFEGRSYAEIARRTGGSVAAVKTRVRDAMIRLRCHLDERRNAEPPGDRPAPSGHLDSQRCR
ncbi:sigma-70 family RNA polymerase sigma factor [soil metagenome]